MIDGRLFYERAIIEEIISAMQETLEQAYGCLINHYGQESHGQESPPVPHHIRRLETAISMLSGSLAAPEEQSK